MRVYTQNISLDTMHKEKVELKTVERNIPRYRPQRQKRHQSAPQGCLRFRLGKALYQSKIPPPLNVYLNVKISWLSPTTTLVFGTSGTLQVMHD
jgi:hypothetical protein